jgi:hypothetical protein
MNINCLNYIKLFINKLIENSIERSFLILIEYTGLMIFIMISILINYIVKMISVIFLFMYEKKNLAEI